MRFEKTCTCGVQMLCWVDLCGLFLHMQHGPNPEHVIEPPIPMSAIYEWTTLEEIRRDPRALVTGPAIDRIHEYESRR